MEKIVPEQMGWVAKARHNGEVIYVDAEKIIIKIKKKKKGLVDTENIELKGKEIRIWAEWPRKKEAALVGTIHSHIRNMITGVSKGFTYKLKIVFSHFPISVKLQGETVLIENFTGERNPRKAKIKGDVKVKIQSDDVLIQGTNIEEVSQTAANIEQATKVKKKDPRVFLDGLYVYERTEGMEE